MLTWIKRMAVGRPYVWYKILYHTTSAEHSVGHEKISATTSSGRQSPQIAVTLIILSCAAERETTMQHQRWTEGKDNNSILQFKQGVRWRAPPPQEIPKSPRVRDWIQWRYLWINLVYSISRGFLAIFVNIYEKVRFWFLCNLAITTYISVSKSWNIVSLKSSQDIATFGDGFSLAV